jgi:hypothetical protein
VNKNREVYTRNSMAAKGEKKSAMEAPDWTWGAPDCAARAGTDVEVAGTSTTTVVVVIEFGTGLQVAGCVGTIVLNTVVV